MDVKKIVRWIPALLWMGIIFYLSAQPAKASSELSSNVMQVLLQFIGNMIAVDEAVFHFIIRKGAHLTAYLILAGLTMFATESRKSRMSVQALVVMGICVLYAISDEIHQLFVPGRSGQVSDVAIDACGALLGISFYLIIRKGLRVWRA